MKRLVGLAFGLVLLVVFVGGGWFAWLQATGPSYRSMARLEVSPAGSARSVLGTSRVESEMPRDVARVHATRMRSDEFLRRVVIWPSAKATAWIEGFGGDVQGAAEALGERVSVRPVEGTHWLEVSMVGDDPDEARVLLDAFLEVYVTGVERRRSDEAATAQSVLQRERDRTTARLQQVALDREGFIREHGLASQGSGQTMLVWLNQQKVLTELELGSLPGTLERMGSKGTPALEAEERRVRDALRDQLEVLDRSLNETRQEERERFTKWHALETLDWKLAEARTRLTQWESALAELRMSRGWLEGPSVVIDQHPKKGERVWWRWPWE